MAYPITNLDEFRLTVFCQHGNQESNNDLRIRCAYTAGAGITDQEVIDFLSPIWAPLMTASFDNTSRYEGSTLRRIVGAGPRPVTKFSQLGTAAGVLARPTMPTQVCGLVSFYTDLSGKKYRGRFYVPFPAVANQAADGEPDPVWVGAALAPIGQEATTARILVSGVNIMRITYGLHPAGQTWADFINFRTHQAWATQRKRGDYGAFNHNPFG